jgi:hypothetical protein
MTRKKFYIASLLMVVLLVIISIIIISYQKTQDDLELQTYLWSKRALNLSDYNMLPTEEISSQNIIAEQIINNKEILWIRNSIYNSTIHTDLNHLGNLLHLIKEPIILITSDGYRPVPSTYDANLVKKILSSPKIKKWYTQNYDKSVIHPKLDFYPIGLDMHTPHTLGSKTFQISEYFKSNRELRLEKFNYYLKTREKYKDLKKNKIYCDSHLSITHPRREEMYNILKNNMFIDFQSAKVHYLDVLEKYAQYKFVLSPRGKGLDCHRTWEAFLLGAIVITESSSLDDMYIKNDLPVIILKNFEELNNITEEQLDIWYNKNKHKTDKNKILQKFDPKYWIK